MVFEVDRISKRFGVKRALHNVSFSVSSGEIVSIIGPSGSGKTTLLKIIAGIESPDSGAVHFSNPPNKQNPVVLVFQDYILFPNLNVYENIAFGLRVRKYSSREIEKLVGDYLSYFDIQEQKELFPSELSAGQRQRTAIARAMIINPSVLLLDEPFANLDKNLKIGTAEFIRETQKKFGVTTISVTHDLEEAFAMSDTIGILLDGQLIQYDTSREVYFNPASIEAASFLGPVNIIPMNYLRWFESAAVSPSDPGSSVSARAESIGIDKNENGPGIIVETRFIGIMILYTIDLNGLKLLVYSLSTDLKPGDRVTLTLNHGMIEGRR